MGITDDNGDEVGMIERSWQGCGRALYTDSDNFHIVFPKEANAQQRATLFAAVFVSISSTSRRKQATNTAVNCLRANASPADCRLAERKCKTLHICMLFEKKI